MRRPGPPRGQRGNGPPPRGGRGGRGAPPNAGPNAANGGRGMSRVARVRRGGRGGRARARARKSQIGAGAVHPQLQGMVQPVVEPPVVVDTPKVKETSNPTVEITSTPVTKKPIVFNPTLSFTGQKVKYPTSPKLSPNTTPKNTTPKITPVQNNSPAPKVISNVTEAEKLIPRVASVSSLAEDIATKEMFKYDPEAESSAAEWLEALVGTKKVGTLHEWLKSGVILCK